MAKLFKPEDFKVSEYPEEYIPVGAIDIIGYDKASDAEYTVKGFFLDGKYYIQEVTKRKNSS
jgi:hypothetical protein